MNNFFNYMIESGISLGLLSLVYLLFLRGETFFKANRMYLLFAVVFSSVLPLLHLSWPGISNLQEAALPSSGTSILLETITVNGSDLSWSLASWISANNLLVLGYLAVSLLIALIVLWRIGQLVRIIGDGPLVRKNGVSCVYIDEDSSPYSFLNYLFVSRNLESQPGWENMLAHETEHIRQKHTVDILALELISIVQWFNPFFWILRRLIKENHEYMADQAVLNTGVAINRYKEVLVTQFIGFQFSMANNFNASLIKTRLNMMTKIKSSGIAKLRYFIGGAMVAALLLVFACENKESVTAVPENEIELKSATSGQPLILIDGEIASKDAMEKLNPDAIQTVNVMKNGSGHWAEKYGELAQNGVIEVVLKAGAADAKKMAQAYGDVFLIVEKMPDFPGGKEALRKYIAEVIKYPVGAIEKGIQGKVYVNFVVEKDGRVGRIRVLRGVHPLLDAEAMRVISSMPEWTPGTQGGAAIAVSYTVPINFSLQ